MDSGKILKICDFGTARIESTQMTNATGSCIYMAPEVIKGRVCLNVILLVKI